MYSIQIYQLCQERRVIIKNSEIEAFMKEASPRGINPSWSTPSNAGPDVLVEIQLPNPINDAEALVIATFKQLSGSFGYLRSHGRSPFQALSDLNLL